MKLIPLLIAAMLVLAHAASTCHAVDDLMIVPASEVNPGLDLQITIETAIGPMFSITDPDGSNFTYGFVAHSPGIEHPLTGIIGQSFVATANTLTSISMPLRAQDPRADSDRLWNFGLWDGPDVVNDRIAAFGSFDVGIQGALVLSHI